MRIYKSGLIIGAVIGGLWLGAAIMPNTRVYADTPSTTTVPTTDTTAVVPATDPTSAPTTAPATTPDIAPPTAVVSTDVSTTTTTPPTSTTPAVVTPTTTPTTTPPSSPTSSTSTDPLDTTAGVTNDIQGTAQTGNATVARSPQGGDATTGNAGDTANLVNSIQSSSSLAGNQLQTFTDNINGDYNGDLVIDPSNYLNNGTTGSQQIPVTDNVNTSGTIDNTVDLAATTGDATVENNGVAGNATTGDASAEANIVNLINSTISNAASFLGIVNVYGDLNGNILLPSDLVNSLLGDPTTASTLPANITNTTNQEVNNAVTLLAQTGQAAVVSNGRAGNATSGNATTNLNLYNLTNSDIVGGNVLLVFVNVAGTWVGLLLNAPAGTSATALGGSITQNSQIPAGSTITNTSNETINNNLNLSSTSGNALVTYNHRAGNATSGNATSTANIVNILGDQIDLSGWLGILIINVYGSWTGSLEIQPAAVPVVVTTSTSQSNIIVAAATPVKPSHKGRTIHAFFFQGTDGGGQSAQTTSSVTSISSTKPSSPFKNVASVVRPLQSEKSGFSGMIGVIGIAVAITAIIIERIAAIKLKP